MTVVDKKLPSNTVPDQSLTIREIYTRYASGRSLTGTRDPQYDWKEGDPHPFTFDDIMPDIGRMDLADRQAILESAKEELDEVKKRLNNIAAAKKRDQARREAELKKRVEELEKAAKEKTPPNNTVEG